MKKHQQISMSKMVALFTVIFLVGSSALLNVCEAHAFCSRAVASRSCPKPPTIDSFNLEAYLGRWYEIGSTARFKLSTEAGVACDQAVYSSTAGKFALLNSGLQVINGAAQIRGVTASARAICSGARNACFQLQAAGQVSHALQSFNTTHSLQLAHQLSFSADAAALHLQRIAEDVTHIQQVNGQISQANASSLQSSIADINEYVDEARREQRQVAGLVGGLNKIGAQVWELGKKAGISVKAKRELQQASKTLTSFAADLKESSSSMKLALNALHAKAISLLTNAQPIQHPHVSFVTGRITQPNATSAGKLEVTINGTTAPYWIIGLESDSKGAYSAAMVYSCREVAGVSAKSLFVLSKERQVDHATLQGFLAKAELLGIYNDCEDPFLLTLQRGGTCGKVPSPSSP